MVGEPPVVVREVLEDLAAAYSQLDSLLRTGTDPALLAFVGQEARFYGSELTALSERCEKASRVAWDSAEVAA